MASDNNLSTLDLQELVQGLSVRDVIRLHILTLDKLWKDEWVRTRNQPQGDWAENLVAEGYNGKLAAKNTKGYDVKTPDGSELQVKSIVFAKRTSYWNEWDFTSVVVVVLDERDLSVVKAIEILRSEVCSIAKEDKHGYFLSLSDAFNSDGTDVTERLKEAERSIKTPPRPALS